MSDGQGGVSGAALATVLAGSVLAYSGLKGKSASGTIRSLIKGQNPSMVAVTNPILTASTTPGTVAGNVTGGATGNVAAFLAAVASQVGKPYVWATPSNPNDPNPQSFDCSGLVMWGLARVGVSTSHFTVTQYQQFTTRRPIGQAQAGDLIFYGNSVLTLHHVAIADGTGNMYEAPTTGIPVRRIAIYNDGDLWPTVCVPLAGK